MKIRQQHLLDYVRQKGLASYEEMAELFKVSTFTIRRDVDYLSRGRLVARVKGGAQRIETPGQFSEAHLPSRMQINLAAKEKIAQKAVEFISPGETIFLDGSSTIACLARVMARVCRNITVVTNSILVALELSEAPDIRLIGLGGIFDRETFSYVGFDPEAPAEALEAFYVDKAFFSCTGFVPEEGTYENAAFNRTTKRLVAQRAKKVFCLIDSSKFGHRALARVLDIGQINTVITEKLDDSAIATNLQARQVEPIVAT